AVGQFIRKYHLENQVQTFSKQLSSRLQNSSGAAVTAITTIGSSIFATVTILALTFMMLIEGPYWLSVLRQNLPADKREYINQLIKDMYRAVKGYVNGQVLL